MSAASLVRRAVAAGVALRVREERLVLSALQPPDEGLLEELRREKSAIVAYLRDLAAWSEEDWQAMFDERAAIMEFDGGLFRDEAETAAADDVRSLRALVRWPP